MQIILYYFLGMYIVIGTMFVVTFSFVIYEGTKTGEYTGLNIPFNYITAFLARYTA